MKKAYRVGQNDFTKLYPGEDITVVFANKAVAPRLKIVEVLKHPLIKIQTKDKAIHLAIFSGGACKAYTGNNNLVDYPKKVIALDNGRPFQATVILHGNKEVINRGGTLYNTSKNPDEFWYTTLEMIEIIK